MRSATARLKESPAIDHWQKGREKIEAEILMIDLLGYDPEPDEKIGTKDRTTLRGLGRAPLHGRADSPTSPGSRSSAGSSSWSSRASSCRAIPRNGSSSSAVRRLRKRKQPGAGRPRERHGHDRARGLGRGAEGRGVRRGAVRRGRQARAQERAAARASRARFGAGDLFAAVPRKLRGQGGRDHDPPAVRRDARRCTTCPTRSATGSPRTR